ncbi:hypothetical protein MTBBW1_790047 [Desulfamplus magnetovallimortis]|uniref:Uncharacterized protein n=1 Tax=Desulfamplus magnetovallimortis TaxID=1246637 RepID=A0A1W1HJK2_9BACT|nr:hypothetical protein MTBBW1_790047 [Desulfamplus magnetovallimortis]
MDSAVDSAVAGKIKQNPHKIKLDQQIKINHVTLAIAREIKLNPQRSYRCPQKTNLPMNLYRTVKPSANT